MLKENQMIKKNVSQQDFRLTHKKPDGGMLEESSESN
jgi:hypothetical protein